MQALIEAYKGVYEDELLDFYLKEYETHVATQKGEVAVEAFESWIDTKVRFGSPGGPCSIYGDTPKERLATYLQWQGIIGFTETIWAIAQGEL